MVERCPLPTIYAVSHASLRFLRETLRNLQRSQSDPDGCTLEDLRCWPPAIPRFGENLGIAPMPWAWSYDPELYSWEAYTHCFFLTLPQVMADAHTERTFWRSSNTLGLIYATGCRTFLAFFWCLGYRFLQYWDIDRLHSLHIVLSLILLIHPSLMKTSLHTKVKYLVRSHDNWILESPLISHCKLFQTLLMPPSRFVPRPRPFLSSNDLRNRQHQDDCSKRHPSKSG